MNQDKGKSIMHIPRIMIIMSLWLWSSGCLSTQSANNERVEKYKVEAFFAEIDELTFRKLQLPGEFYRGDGFPSWDLSENSPYSHELLKDLMMSKQNKVKLFPVINLDIGDEKHINLQSPMNFPASYDANGEVTGEEVRGVGKSFKVSLDNKPDGNLILAYHIENVDFVSTITYFVGPENREVLQPVFSSRSINSKMLVVPGRWRLVGGLTKIQVDENISYMIAGIRVSENE